MKENTDEKITEFSVMVYGDLEKYNEVISKARCRIFYKYENRNGTYITDEFADELLSTIPYAPIKGIYDISENDYTDHGSKNSLGRIYGVVPENPHLAWEAHLDEDGVERIYACVDVLIFTGLYKEASAIVGKAQSMELYSKSIEGDWQFINGDRYFVFKKGCFLGLQVLGEEVEPCFEGAAFFSLIAPIKELLKDYELFVKQIGGEKDMEKLNFKLLDDEKFNSIWSLLNTNYNEENNWTVDYSICSIYENYAVVKNYGDNSYERIHYNNDEDGNMTLGEHEKCFMLDVSENEKAALDALKALNNNSFEKIDENYSAAIQKNSEDGQKIEELNNSVSTLTTERDNANNSLDEANTHLAAAESNYSALKAERDELAAFKANVLKKEKQAIISEYDNKLSDDIIAKYTNSIDDYDAISLKKELAYELVTANPSIFSVNPQFGYVPKEEPRSGIEEILSKYEK